MKTHAVVIGSGPAGSAAAVALARQGARVLLLEANPRARERFAGEWIHPSGVDALAALSIPLPSSCLTIAPGCGFAMFPDDGGAPIALDYPSGSRAAAAEHAQIVATIRETARSFADVEFVEGRVVALDEEDGRVAWQRRGNRERRMLRADLVVVATGRASAIAHSRAQGAGRAPHSSMAGLELRDVSLPFEGRGHVLAAPSGPMLLYRIDTQRARLCVDVPDRALQRDRGRLLAALMPALPDLLIEPVRRAFDRRLSWAAVGFRPRTNLGRGRTVYVGDAVGHLHPLTANGMTQGFLDAITLSNHLDDLRGYRRLRERETYVPELLSNSLYQVMVQGGPDARAVRFAMFRAWREQAVARERTMAILMGDEPIPLGFARAFVRIGLGAMRGCFQGAPSLGAGLRDCARVAPWSRWPAASLVPGPIRRRFRGRGGMQSPFGEIRAVETAPLEESRRRAGEA